MEPPRGTWPPAWTIAGAIALCGLLLFGWRSGQRGLWSAHEGRAAQLAQSIIESGGWLAPRLYTGELEQQKPPLYYVLVAFASLVNGSVTASMVRLPALAGAVAGLVITYRLGARHWDRQTGIWAAIILAATTRYAWLARVGRIDMPLTLVVLIALALFWRHFDARGEANPSDRRSSWWCYLVMAIGALLKGPIAVLLVLLPVGVYLFWTKEPLVPIVQTGWRATWRQCRFLPGMALVAALAGPWFGWMVWVSGGTFFDEFFLHHNLERALGNDEALKSGPVWFYIPRLLVDSFPWSLLFPAVGLSLWQHRRRMQDLSDPRIRMYLFLLSWIGSHFVFWSLVSFKRADYALPMYPAIALVLAGWLHDRLERFERRLATRPARNPRRRARWILATAFVVAATAAPLLLWAIIEFCKKGVVRSMFKLEVFQAYLNGTDRFMLHHVEVLLRENWPMLGISMVAIVGCVWVFHTGWYHRRNWSVVCGLACPWLVGYLFMVHLILPAIDPVREMSVFGQAVRMLAGPEQTVHYFGKFDPDLVFHAGRPARFIADWNDLEQLAGRGLPVFVVMKAEHFEMMEPAPGSVGWFAIADNRKTPFGAHRDPRVLVTNQPLAVAVRPR